MTTIVIDSSVLIKWFLPETDFALARKIQDKMLDKNWNLLAPSLLLAEVANILWKKNDAVSEEEALNIIQTVLSSGVEFVPLEGLISSAYHLARKYGRTAYDSLYLALAIEHICDFVTADERLFNAVAAQEPRVKLLRAYPVE